MPVPYETVPYEQLLCHQAAYDLIDLAGRDRFENWDVLEFAKAILGMGNTRYICTDEDYQAVIGNLKSLNSTMPFLKYGELGQHYAYELFLSPPDHWSSRGAPFFWAYVARQFTFDRLPMTEDAFKAKYMTIVEMLDIPFGKDEYVYIKRFAAGGMSSGMVGGIFVQEALDKLIYRLKKY
jgi:hypothetical protein